MIQQTSLESYFNLDTESLARRYLQIYSVLFNHGASTDREIAARLGYSDPNAIRPRRNELYKAQRVRCAGKRKCQVTGKKAMVWELVR